jgi:hypothetical protein
VHQRKRYLWDREGVKGYECQTSAREDSVRENIGKSERWGVAMVWVAETKEIQSEIKKVIEGRGEFMVI